jgi:hypothetical protein
VADVEPLAVVAVEVTETPLPDLVTRIQWFEEWEQSTHDNQLLARRDRQYYDGQQWTDDEIKALEDRHQPVLTKNRIARKVNFILGEEIRKRVDPVARPRTPQHEDAARAATDALRYVEEEQDFDTVRGSVLKDMIIEGYGGGVVEVDDEDEYCIKLRHVPWDRLFYDPNSYRTDFADAKYKGVVLWMDLDDAIEAYPDSEEELKAAVAHDFSGMFTDTTSDKPRTWADGKRKRVKIVEMYFRIGREWYRSDFTKGADLRPPELTAYMDERGKHHCCPLVMASCYVDSDNMRYGVVRGLISPQDEINKRSSKALHLLSVRQVIAERDSIRDPQKFQSELAKPDGYAETEPGALQEGRVQTTQTGDLAQGQIALLQESKQDIDSIGPASSMLSEMGAGTSGRAFMARQQSAAQELGAVFDTLRGWDKDVFYRDWSCIRQFWTEERWLRVTDDQELTGYRFVAINRSITRAQRLQDLMKKGASLESAVQTAAGDAAPIIMQQVGQAHQAMQQQAQMMAQQPPEFVPDHMQQMVMAHPLMQQVITENQVDQMLVDLVIDEAPESAVIEQEEFEKLSEIMPTVIGGNPGLGPQMVKLLIKASQLRNKQELLRDLEKGPDPQEAQMAQAMKALGVAGAQAKVEVDKSTAQLNQAKAANEAANAQVVVPKAQADITQSQAYSMVHAANAGEKVGGGMMP